MKSNFKLANFGNTAQIIQLLIWIDLSLMQVYIFSIFIKNFLNIWKEKNFNIKIQYDFRRKWHLWRKTISSQFFKSEFVDCANSSKRLFCVLKKNWNNFLKVWFISSRKKCVFFLTFLGENDCTMQKKFLHVLSDKKKGLF